MDEDEKTRVLELYPEFRTVYGPYLRKDGRQTVVLYDGKRQSSRQLAKVRLEVKIGRRLLEGETVDHKDENFANDDPENLQILSHSANAAKTSRADNRFVRKDNDQVCVVCQSEFRNKKVKQTCGSVLCKSENRRRISLHLGLNPSVFTGRKTSSS